MKTLLSVLVSTDKNRGTWEGAVLSGGIDSKGAHRWMWYEGCRQENQAPGYDSLAETVMVRLAFFSTSLCPGLALCSSRTRFPSHSLYRIHLYPRTWQTAVTLRSLGNLEKASAVSSRGMVYDSVWERRAPVSLLKTCYGTTDPGFVLISSPPPCMYDRVPVFTTIVSSVLYSALVYFV